MTLATAHDTSHLQRDAFRDVARRLFGNITQRFLHKSDRDRIQLSYVSLGNCRLSKIAAPAHGVLGKRVVEKSYDEDSIKVLVQMKGKARLRQNFEKFDLSSRTAVIYDPTRDYSLINETDVEQIILQAPRDLFDDRMLNRLSRPLFLPAIGDQQSLTLTSFIRTSARTAVNMGFDVRASLGQSLVVFTQGIVSEAFHEDMVDTVHKGSLTLLRERIKEYVTDNISDSELSIERIAKRMGCTPRYLHKAFEADGETLQRYILKKRLETSRSLLLLPENRNRTISEMAFKCGFNSSAHFSRVFKQRFNKSPNEMRAP